MEKRTNRQTKKWTKQRFSKKAKTCKALKTNRQTDKVRLTDRNWNGQKEIGLDKPKIKMNNQKVRRTHIKCMGQTEYEMGRQKVRWKDRR